MTEHQVREGSARWQVLLNLEDLHGDGLRTVKHEGHQLVIGRSEDGELFALDNRCPHEGYPLAQGDLKGCLLTCEWHNWKFDVRDGSCVLGGEAVRSYRVRITEGAVEVDLAEPDRALQHGAWLESLREGLRRKDVGRAIRDGVRLVDSGFGAERLLGEIARYDGQHAEYGSTHALPLCADALRTLDRYTGARAMVAIAPAMDMCMDANVRQPERQRPAPSSGATAEKLIEAVEEQDAPRAEGLLLGALAAGTARAEVESWMYRVMSRHFTDFGHQLIYLVKAQELLDIVNDDLAPDILSPLLFSTLVATREDTLPYFAGYMRRFGKLEPELPELYAAARDGAPFDPALLRDATLDGSLDEACSTLIEALRAGVPAPRIARALVVAAAERLLRFDLRHDADPLVAEGWLWATHRFTFASAVRNTTRRFQHPDALRFLFQALAFIHSGHRMDAPPDRRYDPAPVDAEAAGVLEAIAARDVDLSLARTRGYLASKRPIEALRTALEDLCLDDPLVRPIVVAHAIKTTWAAFEEHAALADDPDRDRPLLAAVRLLASPIAERNVRRTVENSIRWVSEGVMPKKLTQ